MPRDEYERLLRRLQVLRRIPGTDRARERVLEQMEQVWNHLTQKERAALDRLERELRE